MRNLSNMGFWKWGGIWLLAGALTLSLGGCRTQDGPVVQEKKDNREQTGAFEIQGLEVRTFSGLDATRVIDATSATMDLKKNMAFLNQIVGTQYTSGTPTQTFSGRSGLYFTETPAKNQRVPEYVPGVRPRRGDFYLQGGVNVNNSGQTVEAPSLFYLHVPTTATLTGKAADATTVSIRSGGGNVRLGIPPGKEGGGRAVIEAKSLKTDYRHQKINFDGPVSVKMENSTTSTQNVAPVSTTSTQSVAPVAEPVSTRTQSVAPSVSEKKGTTLVSPKPATKANSVVTGKKSASKAKPKVKK
ncbi:MAG TPA: hypothetical protein PKH31_05820 [Candidatus Sumerlaeota bacterium]|nr:hypothetical protein [Candidatus Sumerlaeota bacterium]